MKTLVFFVFCIIIGLTLAAANHGVCGNGRDEQSMRCCGELSDREGSVSVLAVADKEPSLTQVEQIIRDRLTPFTGKFIECSFRCDHKQKEFNGCDCPTTIKYNTTLEKCPDDVTRISSTSLKWAWDQCEAIKCNCAIIDDTIADQRTLYAYKVLDKVQPIRKNGDVQGFFKVVQKSFTTHVLGYKPESFSKNLRHYISRAVRKISSFFNLAKVAAFFGRTFKAIGQGIANAFNAVKNFVTNVGSYFANLIKKNGVVRAVTSWLKQKFGAAGTVISNVFKTAKKFASAAGKAFKKVWENVKHNPIVRKFIGGVKRVYGLAKAGIKKLGGFAKKLGVKIGSGLKKGLAKARQGFKKLGNGIKKGWNKAKTGLRKFGTGLKKGASKFKNGLGKFGSGVKKGIRKFGNGLKKGASKFKNGLRKFGSGLKKGAKKFKNGLGKFGSGVKKGIRKFGTGLKKGASKFKNGLRKFGSGFKRGFSKTKQTIKSIGNGVKRGISKFTGGFKKVSSGFASNVGKGFSNAKRGLSNAAKKAGGLAKKASSAVRSFMSRI